MSNVTKLLKDIILKAGIKNNPEIETFLAANAEVLDALDFPVVATNLIKENVFGMEEAKTKIELKSHFIGKFGDSIETDVFNTLKDAGLSDDELTGIKSVSNSTGKRISKAFEVLNTKIEDARKGAGKGHSEEFVKKIQEKEMELNNFRTQAEQEKAQLLSENAKTIERLWRGSNLASVKWNPAISEDLRLASYEAGINAKLEKLGGKLIFDAKTLNAKIVQAKDETLPLMNGANEFGFTDLHSLVLQDYKLLDEGTGGGSGGQHTPNFTPPDKGNQGATQVANYAKAEIDSGLSTLQEMAQNKF